MARVRIVAILAAILAATVFFLHVAQRPGDATAESTRYPVNREAASDTQVRSDVFLYFGGVRPPYLSAEKRRIEHPTGEPGLARSILSALLEGSLEGKAPVIPTGTRLRSLFLTDGIAWVDLSAEASEAHPGGVAAETATIYAIVNSLTLNLQSVEAVRILIDGQERTTLAGHIDLTHPLPADMMLIK